MTNAVEQVLRTTLGGQQVGLRLRWSPLAGAWYLSVARPGSRLATGRQVVPWRRLLGTQLTDFDGDLIVLATKGNDDVSVGRRAWTETHALWYLTDAEIADVEARLADYGDVTL
ncbi:MAG: hypothetical protein OXG79_12395 [Chloroflexi bacterium]|nr:hypothetical protein [Chloroflexota bacterium]